MKRLEIAALATIVPAIFGLSSFMNNSDRHIIYVNFVDVSDSAQNYRSPEGNTYQSLISDNCRFYLEQLNTEDIYIAGKFTTQALSTNHKINYVEKNQLMDRCSQTTELERRMRHQPGTSLKVAIDTLKSEVEKQRNRHIDYPVAAVITIDAVEPTPNQTSEDLKATVETVKNMVDRENMEIVFVGAEAELTSKLQEQFRGVSGVEFKSIQDLDNASENVIKSARKRQPVKITKKS